MDPAVGLPAVVRFKERSAKMIIYLKLCNHKSIALKLISCVASGRKTKSSAIIVPMLATLTIVYGKGILVHKSVSTMMPNLAFILAAECKSRFSLTIKMSYV